jgi:hypothetical protein
MRSEMHKQNLFPPIFFTYPNLEDSVNVILFNEERPSEWEKVYKYLKTNKYINNQQARDIIGIVQIDKMSRLFKKWTQQGLLDVVMSKGKAPKYTKYKLPNKDELN